MYFRLRLKQVLQIAMGWIAVGILDALFFHLVSSNDYIQKTALYNIRDIFLVNLFGYAWGGLMVGILLVFVLKGKFRKRPFIQYLFINTGIILALGVALNISVSLLYFSNDLGEPLFSKPVLAELKRFFVNPLNLKNILLGIMTLFGTMIIIQVNDKYGPGIFFKLLTGKYHFPREEERIFMFLDLRSSTELAEKLGHVKYHRLLEKFFREITDPILLYRGEIYQYVGDEMVITWTLEKGTKDLAFIRCFFAMKKVIENESQSYIDEFVLVPEFKAGAHFGTVTVGEIGEIKKDLVYSGDVLSTAARIQSLCNEMNSKFLISKEFISILPGLESQFNLEEKGSASLKGIKENMELVSISK